MSNSEPKNIKIIQVNKKARFDYHLEESFEAGLVLTGSEVKSIKAGRVALQESYIRPFEDGIYLLGANVSKYSHDNNLHYDPVRAKKLLLNAKEINKLRGGVSMKGYTIVPVEIYLKNGRVKLQIALAKGKSAPDKRDTIKDREAKREIARALK